MNYDGSVDQGHISLQYCNREPTEAIRCVGRIFYVRHGDEFIQQCFQGLKDLNDSGMESMPFLGGRIQWDSMFSETFGKDFEDLINLSLEHSNPLPGPEIILVLEDRFARLFIVGAAFFVLHTTEACRYKDIMEFVLSAMSSIPELRPCKHKLLDPAIQHKASAMSLEELSEEYKNIRIILNREHLAVDEQYHRRSFCLATITETILIMSYLLGRLTLEGSLLPKRSGILKIYNDIPMFSGLGLVSESESFRLQALLYPEESIKPLSFQFLKYVSIFSGEPAPFSMGDSTSALSDGKVYCFIDTLQGLSDSFEKASVIHVGARSIQAGNQLHERVYDPHRPSETHSLLYQAECVQLVEKGLCPFAEDSTSRDLSMKAAVEESVHLSFWYHVSSKLGATLISPGSFVQNRLREAVAFKKNRTQRQKSLIKVRKFLIMINTFL